MEKSPQPQGRRQRALFVARVLIRTPGLDALAEELSGNISLGGIFIRANRPPEVGTEVLLSVQTMPAGKGLIEAKGRVAWRRPKSDPRTGEPAGMGVEFTWLSAASRPVLQAIVEESGPRPS